MTSSSKNNNNNGLDVFILLELFTFLSFQGDVDIKMPFELLNLEFIHR